MNKPKSQKDIKLIINCMQLGVYSHRATIINRPHSDKGFDERIQCADIVPDVFLSDSMNSSEK